ncbi:MAG: response regulator, partial [Spirochaetia bacterium]|nr:response regulator [Spirochaetia bacterium]
MKKKILDVGQCGPDHYAIKHALEPFDVEIRKCNHPEQAMKILKEHHFDLVFVNRKIDIDYSEGIELVRMMKKDPVTKNIPVMLITNFPEHQKMAVQEGAVKGFGKDDLSSSSFKKLIQEYLD